MPGKRTNDSVDKILEELNRQQLEQGVRSSLNDQQVDEILRSVGIDVGAAAPVHAPQQTEVDALLADLCPVPAAQPVPPRETPVFEDPAPQPAPQSVPQPQPEPAPQPQPVSTADTQSGTVGDTTSTGIIKNFLLKMAPDADSADTGALNQGKEQFKDFFGRSVAVVPDEKGRLRADRSTGTTGEFVPINISLSGGRSTEEGGIPRSDRPAKKRGGLFGLFGRRDPVEEDEPESTPEPSPLPAPQPKPAPQPVEEDGKAVYRSKYTASRRGRDPIQELQELPELPPELRPAAQMPPAAPAPSQPAPQPVIPVAPAPQSVNLSGNPLPPLADKPTGTIFRKKRDTVEFIPHKKETAAPAAPPVSRQAAPQPVMPAAPVPSQPAPQPATTYSSTGFTVQMDALSGQPLDSTQEFLAAFEQVRPRPAAAKPAQAPQPTMPPMQAPSVPPVQATAAPAPQPMELPDTIPDSREELDRLVDTITGQIRLDQYNNIPVPPPAAPSPAAPKRKASDFVSNIADNINAQPTAQIPDLSSYDTAAARLLGNQPIPGDNAGEPEKTSARLKKIAGKVRLSGTPKDEKAPSADGAFTEELPRLHGTPRYDSAEDIPAVRRALDHQVLILQASTALTGLLALAMLYLGIAAAGSTLPIPGPLDPATGKTALLGVMLGMLLLSGALCWRTLWGGIKGLAGQPSADSMPMLAFAGAAAQLIVFLVSPQQYTPNTLSLMAGPAALLLCFNHLGKAMDACSQRDGFRLVSAGVDHAVAYRLKDAGMLRAVTRGLAEPRPCVLVSRPTQLLKGFLNAGAARRTSDKNQQQFAWGLGVCAVASFVVTMIRQQGAGSAFSALAAVLVLGTPLAGTLLSALPARLMQRSAAQVGAVIPGWKDIRQLGRINVIQVTARDLFPAGCVSLCGIKPVHKEHIDQAIVYAASMLSESNSLLRDVFLGMIGDNKLIAKVADRQTAYGKGYVGWISGQRVLIGNRALMADYNVQLPSMEYEQRHTVNQRRVIYLAVSGKLFAMFQVAYQRDPDTAAVLDSLRRSGLSVIVDCDDFNVDEALLEAAYSLPAGAVKVLTGPEREALAPATAWLPESAGNMLHLGSFISFVGGLEAAAGAAEGERKAAMVMCASVLFSCLLSLIMVFSAGLAQLALPYIVLYQATWAVLALIFPMIQRY